MFQSGSRSNFHVLGRLKIPFQENRHFPTCSNPIRNLIHSSTVDRRSTRFRPRRDCRICASDDCHSAAETAGKYRGADLLNKWFQTFRMKLLPCSNKEKRGLFDNGHHSNFRMQKQDLVQSILKANANIDTRFSEHQKLTKPADSGWEKGSDHSVRSSHKQNWTLFVFFSPFAKSGWR